jgi:signal transduction histidine kinase
MHIPNPLARPRVRLHLPRRTVRLRLTLLYGSLFLASGVALLAITYVLVEDTFPVFNQTSTGLGGTSISGGFSGPGGRRSLPITPSAAAALLSQLRNADLHQLLVDSSIALAIMVVISVALGWLIAGRVLRPLRTMITMTRQISEDNMHERLALHGPRDELKDLGDTIDGLLGRLEGTFDAQRLFVANASHELRTPLTMMRTSVDVATGKRKPVPVEVTVLAEKLREGLDQADRLLESFLVLARVQYGAISDRTIVSLHELVSVAIDSRSGAVASARLNVQRTGCDALVEGSGTLLARMVENVIDNAIRHNDRGGFIRVETKVDGGVARLVVENGGSLLDESKVRELGQPFRRLGVDRTPSQAGLGLGLSIVSAIATSHHGRMELHARPEGGLGVIIDLPYTLDPVPVVAVK